MKYLTLLLVLLLLGCTEEQSKLEPYFMPREAFNAAVQVVPPRPFKSPSNVVVYNGYAYVVEPFEGLHINQIQDPSNAQRLAFLVVPGVQDVQVTGNYLVVDAATDLLQFDLINPAAPELHSRRENIFKEMAPPDGLPLSEDYAVANRPGDLVLVKWVYR